MDKVIKEELVDWGFRSSIMPAIEQEEVDSENDQEEEGSKNEQQEEEQTNNIGSVNEENNLRGKHKNSAAWEIEENSNESGEISAEEMTSAEKYTYELPSSSACIDGIGHINNGEYGIYDRFQGHSFPNDSRSRRKQDLSSSSSRFPSVSQLLASAVGQDGDSDIRIISSFDPGDRVLRSFVPAKTEIRNCCKLESRNSSPTNVRRPDIGIYSRPTTSRSNSPSIFKTFKASRVSILTQRGRISVPVRSVETRMDKVETRMGNDEKRMDNMESKLGNSESRSASIVESNQESRTDPTKRALIGGCNIGKLFPCPLCLLRFHQRSELSGHFKECHGEEITTIGRVFEKEEVPETAPRSYNYYPVEQNWRYMNVTTAFHNHKGYIEPEEHRYEKKTESSGSFITGDTATVSDDHPSQPDRPSQRELNVKLNFEQPSAELDRCHVCDRQNLEDVSQHVNKFHPDWVPCLFSFCTTWFVSSSSRARHLLTAHPPEFIRRLPPAALVYEEDSTTVSKAQEKLAPSSSYQSQEPKSIQKPPKNGKRSHKRKPAITTLEEGEDPGPRKKKGRNAIQTKGEETLEITEKEAEEGVYASYSLLTGKTTKKRRKKDEGIDPLPDLPWTEPVGVQAACNICRLKLRSCRGLASHMQKMHGNDLVARCQLCQNWYKSGKKMSNIREHMEREHGMMQQGRKWQ